MRAHGGVERAFCSPRFDESVVAAGIQQKLAGSRWSIESTARSRGRGHDYQDHRAAVTLRNPRARARLRDRDNWVAVEQQQSGARERSAASATRMASRRKFRDGAAARSRRSPSRPKSAPRARALRKRRSRPARMDVAELQRIGSCSTAAMRRARSLSREHGSIRLKGPPGASCATAPTARSCCIRYGRSRNGRSRTRPRRE